MGIFHGLPELGIHLLVFSDETSQTGHGSPNAHAANPRCDSIHAAASCPGASGALQGVVDPSVALGLVQARNSQPGTQEHSGSIPNCACNNGSWWAT